MLILVVILLGFNIGMQEITILCNVIMKSNRQVANKALYYVILSCSRLVQRSRGMFDIIILIQL